jgi:valyl-tRNA synthetase
MQEVPFRDVLINSLVLDPLGRKMSKSLGNSKDPLDVIDTYGADTLRFTLLTGNTPGSEMRFQQERVEGSRNFANKVWNASRFALMNLEDFHPDSAGFDQAALTLADRWILSRFNRTIGEVDRNLESYELGEAARVLYEFIWDELCDWYIELAKPRLYGKETADSRRTAQQVIWHVLRHTLELLHPFMPFLTEEIWQHLPDDRSQKSEVSSQESTEGIGDANPNKTPTTEDRRPTSIMVASWPVRRPDLDDPVSEAQMALLMDLIRGIRNLRGELGLSPGKPARCVAVAADAATRQLLERYASYIAQLAAAQPLEFAGTEQPKPKQAFSYVAPGGIEVYIPLAGLVDLDKEIARLEKESGVISRELERVRGKLANESFLAKAPPEVIDKERDKETELSQKLATIGRRLEQFAGR